MHTAILPEPKRERRGGRSFPFFSPDSYWNTPVPAGAATDPESSCWIGQLADAVRRTTGGLHINLHSWTIPVYYADSSTPRVWLHPNLLHCRFSQGHVKTLEHRLRARDPQLQFPGLHPCIRDGIPIPECAMPDAESDAHMTIIDVDERIAYDLWNCHRKTDGAWHTNAAIAYPVDGDGMFSPSDIPGIRNDESVHFYGPCRASGIPALAGLVLRAELESGCIHHKLALASPVNGLQRHVCPPAIWTDGWLPGGIPEGACLQLDPALDLDSLPLTHEARVIARALQTHGAVLVDNAGSVTLYGEYAPPGAYAGLVEDALVSIPVGRFRVLDTRANLRSGGSHPVYHHEMAPLFYEYLGTHGDAALDALAGLESWRADRSYPAG
ncbi:MAG: hypothetical protein LBK99_21695 [Opitutaceae bacterium]|jgi:hypothetical protein|nr:hypothetical protein [Opitutaceae bacterium]